MTTVDVYLDIAGDQIDGARDYQEDAFLITYVDDDGGRPKSTALLAMADGVGGAAAGNIASQLVTNTFNRQFTSRFGKESIPGILRDALHRANESLKKSVTETPGLAGMGCTVVTAVVSRGKLWWVSVGDSHLYLVRDGTLTKKNADHSYGAYLDMMGAKGTPVEPDPNLRRNMLMSAMSGDDIAMIDCPEEPFKLVPGDRLIVSSDGLDTLDSATILAAAAASPTPKGCVAALLQAVTDAAKPRQDNTTVVVCDVVAEAPPPEPVKAPAPPDKHAIWEAEERAEKRQKQVRRVMHIGALLAAIVAAAWAVDRFDVPGRIAALSTPPSPAQPEAADVPPDTTEADAPEMAPLAPEFVAPAPVDPPFHDPLRSGGQGPRMVSLPAGTFLMGVRGSSDPAETPAHPVAVPSFAVSVHEITFAEYDRFARATGRGQPPSNGLDRARHPVFGVSWEDAAAYAAWLSRETGHAYSLPSEAQWEYAASAGSTAPYWWGYTPPQGRAHCFNCTAGLPNRQPVPVGSFEPNRFGLYDTVGNVAEWVQDCFHPNYRDAPADGSVWAGGDCSVRVVRGGHYASPTPTAQKRDRFAPDRGYPDIGFRVVRQ